ncbi:YybS family protein [Geomicrobium sp. JCM 19039]|uniref:YybS family protein n=1 Tax=Geomicrobium sp. JCM 19039 TaxID=1460636 RepID=UPI0005A989D1|nr:YybS family protein [Geomicrobium sp. JCM 19039]
MNQSRRLTEGAVMVAVFAVLIALLYIPLIALFTIWFLPLPVMIYTVRHGAKPGLIVLVVAALVSFLIGSVLALPAILIFGIGGYVTGLSYARGKGPFQTLFAGSVSYVLSIIVFFVFSNLVLQVHPFEAMVDIMIESTNSAEQLITAVGADVNEEALTLYREMAQMIPQYSALIMIFTGVVFAFLTQVVAHPILRRFVKGNFGFPPLRTWSLPTFFIWVYLIGIVFRLISYSDPGSGLYTFMQNVSPILEAAMIIQGAAVMFYFAHVKNISRAFPILILVSILLVPFVGFLVRMLGIIDLGFDLRSRIKSDKK